jgi:hypothetical protein
VEWSGHPRELTSALWNFALEKCREERKKNKHTLKPRISSGGLTSSMVSQEDFTDFVKKSLCFYFRQVRAGV